MRILLFMRSLRALFLLLALFFFGKSYLIVAQVESIEGVVEEEITDTEEKNVAEAPGVSEEEFVAEEAIGEDITDNQGDVVVDTQKETVGDDVIGKETGEVVDEQVLEEEAVAIEDKTTEKNLKEEAVEKDETTEKTEEEASEEEPISERGGSGEGQESEEQREDKPAVIEIKGIDTLDVDEPKGNWLLKRIWWEKAERWYEKIKQVKQDILESRMFFFQKRTELDRNAFDPFYVKVGVGQGELQEIISSLLAKLEQMREEQGSLNEQEREFLVVLELEQETLKNLEQKLKSVNAVDNGIDDALMKLMEQINLAREYERQAWDTFKAITRELSDKRARELYYSMDNMWNNIGATSSYIKDQFTPYFNQMIEKAQELIADMEKAIILLKEKGVDLKTQAQKLSKKDSGKKQEKLEEKTKRSTKKEKTERTISGWFDWLFDFFSMITGSFSAILDYIVSFFVTVPTATESTEDAQR